MSPEQVHTLADNLTDLYFEDKQDAVVKQLSKLPGALAAYLAVRIFEEVRRHRAELSDAFPAAAFKRRLKEAIP